MPVPRRSFLRVAAAAWLLVAAACSTTGLRRVTMEQLIEGKCVGGVTLAALNPPELSDQSLDAAKASSVCIHYERGSSRIRLHEMGFKVVDFFPDTIWADVADTPNVYVGPDWFRKGTGVITGIAARARELGIEVRELRHHVDSYGNLYATNHERLYAVVARDHDTGVCDLCGLFVVTKLSGLKDRAMTWDETRAKFEKAVAAGDLQGAVALVKPFRVDGAAEAAELVAQLDLSRSEMMQKIAAWDQELQQSAPRDRCASLARVVPLLEETRKWSWPWTGRAMDLVEKHAREALAALRPPAGDEKDQNGAAAHALTLASAKLVWVAETADRARGKSDRGGRAFEDPGSEPQSIIHGDHVFVAAEVAAELEAAGLLAEFARFWSAASLPRRVERIDWLTGAGREQLAAATRSADVLKGLHAAVATELVAEVHDAAAAAAAAGWPAQAAGFWLAEYGLRGGSKDDYLSFAAARTALEGQADPGSPLAHARQQLVADRLLALVPFPAQDEKAHPALRRAYDVDAPIGKWPLCRFARLSSGGFEVAVEVGKAVGALPVRIEVDEPHRSRFSPVTTQSTDKSWFNVIENVAATAEYEQALAKVNARKADLARRIAECDGQARPYLPSNGHPMTHSFTEQRDVTTPSEQKLGLRRVAVVTTTTTWDFDRPYQSECENLISERDRLVDEYNNIRPPKTGAAHEREVLKEWSYKIDWQRWSGSIARNVRVVLPAGTVTFEQEVIATDYELARIVDDPAHNVRGRDEWTDEAGMRAITVRRLDTLLATDLVRWLAKVRDGSIERYATEVRARPGADEKVHGFARAEVEVDFAKGLFGALEIDEPGYASGFPVAQLLRIAFLVPTITATR